MGAYTLRSMITAQELLPANFGVNVSGMAADFHHSWEECVGSGHASLTLRSDWRSHLSRCQREFGFKRTRFHGILDDDFSISISEGVYSFVNLDSLIDFHASIDMVPLFELSFMPGTLCVCECVDVVLNSMALSISCCFSMASIQQKPHDLSLQRHC